MATSQSSTRYAQRLLKYTTSPPPIGRRNLPLIGTWPASLVSLAALLALMLSLPAHPSEPSHDGAHRWSAAAFVGQFDDSRFLDILALDGGDLRSSYIGGAVLGRLLGHWPAPVAWEAEAQIYHHWGLQSLWEANLGIAARWTRFPWDRWLDTSVSLGQGVSHASQRPPLEDETRNLLHYMHFEIAVQVPGSERVSLAGRLHHRSGGFGTYGVTGGSNFLALGIRYRF